MTKENTGHFKLAILILLSFTVFRFFYAGSFLLVPDETNYWQWGRHLSFGYHDQAPMIGWLIRFFCEILGDREISVRLPSILSMGLAAFYLILFARRWYGERAALACSILIQSVFLFQAGAILATADGIQALGWAGASYHIARAYEEDKKEQWLAGGLWLGFGLLSKFTMVLFAFFALGYGLFSKEHRKRLKGVWPWLSALIAALIFSPVLYWNHTNNWNSLRHVAHLGGANESSFFKLNYLGEYLGSEILLLNPFTFILVILAWIAVFRKDAPGKSWVNHYLMAISLPVFIFFTILSLKARIYGNWPATAYLGTSVLIAAFFTGKDKSKPKFYLKAGKLYLPALVTGFLFTGILFTELSFNILPIPPEKNRIAKETSGWDKLGLKVYKLAEDMEKPEDSFFFGIRYQFASELAFYIPGKPETVSINRWARPNVYDYWWEDKDLKGKDAIGVLRYPGFKTRLEEVFEKVDEPIVFPMELKGKKLRELYIYRCYGFKGGLRWKASDPSDVRAVKNSGS